MYFRCGAQTTVRTATQQMTVLHILYLIGRKSAQDTLATTRLLLDSGMRESINEADSLGNTPLHGLIVRYALEEARYGFDHDNQPWNKWDVLHLVITSSLFAFENKKCLPISVHSCTPFRFVIYFKMGPGHQSISQATLLLLVCCGMCEIGNFAMSY